MISEEDFLQAEIKAGIHYGNPLFVQLAESVVKAVSDLPIKTVLDYGAGTGVYAKVFSQSYDVKVWEKFAAHKNYIKEHYPELPIIEKPITTDLMLFIEVAEHMTDEELNNLFNQIQPTYILFSSTSERTPFDAAWGHINVKEQPEWVDLFQAKGYELLKELETPTKWAKLFRYG